LWGEFPQRHLASLTYEGDKKKMMDAS